MLIIKHQLINAFQQIVKMTPGPFLGEKNVKKTFYSINTESNKFYTVNKNSNCIHFLV